MQNKLKYIQDTFNGVTLDTTKINSFYEKQNNSESNIAIKLLSVFGGIFSSLVFILFIAISGIWTNGYFMEIFGIILIVFSIFLSKKVANLLLDTFSISAYIVGVILLVFGMQYLKTPVNTTILTVLIIGIVTLFLNQIAVFSFIATLMIQGSILFFIYYNRANDAISFFILINGLLLVLINFNEAYLLTFHKKINKLLYPVKIAIVVAFIFGLSILSVENLIRMHYINWNILAIGIGILFLFTVYKIVKITVITNKRALLFIYIASILIAVFSYYAPSIIGGLLLILLGFYNNDKVVFVLGILSFIVFTGMYYYNLNETLLFKSILLISIGMVFMAFYLFLLKTKSLEKI